ncbi:MAG: EAL domain-containing protein [Deltaproteobacteria bacterium]|nr:EAL domain-containing protein [Deltaproteobacteria bacterium]
MGEPAPVTLDEEDHPVSGGVPGYAYAFQPIVDVHRRRIYSYEALIRGPQGEPAWSVLGRVAPEAASAFDHQTRVAAITAAGRLGIDCHLNVNCLPSSLEDPAAALAATLTAARRARLPLSRLIIEVTENEMIADRERFAHTIGEFRRAGVKIAIDDFGAGYSGLNLLAEFQPDLIKLDMALVRGIESHGPRQAIVRAIVSACEDLGMEIIAEGVETLDELSWCEDAGVSLFQGYLLGRPGFDCLPEAELPARR